jgi:hypothetical protein
MCARVRGVTMASRMCSVLTSTRIIREITRDRVKVRNAFTDPAGRVFESFRKAGPPTEEDLALLRLLE